MNVPNLLTTTGALNRLDMAEIEVEAAALKANFDVGHSEQRALALVM